MELRMLIKTHFSYFLMKVRLTHRSAPLLLEGTQKKFKAREILEVLSTESYRTDSRIRLGTGAYRW